MDSATTQRILQSPDFKALIAARRKLSWPILITIWVAYFGFVLFIAFDPAALGQPVGDGVVSIGIYIGLALLVLAFALTAIYLRCADGKIKILLQQIIAKNS